jgi:hypothetical protein
MPQVLIVLIAVVAGIASVFLLIQIFAEDDKLLWGLWFGIAASLMTGMILWVNLDHNVPDVEYATYQLERKEHTIYFTEDGKVKNATSIFGIDNIDPEKQVIVKHGPSTTWSYGRYMDLCAGGQVKYTLTEKPKP